MKKCHYLSNVSTLTFNGEVCVGCGVCTQVCPHAVFEMGTHQAVLVNKDGCMECGACALNCPTAAISVTPGVGCAAYIIDGWKKKYWPNARLKTPCCG